MKKSSMKQSAIWGLKEFEERYIDELSGGQRQRAYIAMTIAQDTEYIFLMNL
jgi:ABC-type enterochelin transport system, ATPase component